MKEEGHIPLTKKLGSSSIYQKSLGRLPFIYISIYPLHNKNWKIPNFPNKAPKSPTNTNIAFQRKHFYKWAETGVECGGLSVIPDGKGDAYETDILRLQTLVSWFFPRWVEIEPCDGIS